MLHESLNALVCSTRPRVSVFGTGAAWVIENNQKMDGSENILAIGLKIESKRFGLDLKSVFGRNSPVKSTISVDRMVSAGT